MRGTLDQHGTAEQPVWHHILLVLTYPQHQGLTSSPASPQDFGTASSALHLLQTGDWNVLRHHAEEGTEISASPQAAQF